MYSLLIFDEGEIWIGIFLLLPLFITLIVFGFIVPIIAAITVAIYHFRMKYKFTWEKDFIEQEMAKAGAAK